MVLVLKEPSNVMMILELGKHIVIPDSSWESKDKIDDIWCLMGKINPLVFRNIFKVRKHPEFLDYLTVDSNHVILYKFEKLRMSSEVRVNPNYSSQNRKYVNNIADSFTCSVNIWNVWH